MTFSRKISPVGAERNHPVARSVSRTLEKHLRKRASRSSFDSNGGCSAACSVCQYVSEEGEGFDEMVSLCLGKDRIVACDAAVPSA